MDDTRSLIERVYRAECGRVQAHLIGVLGDFHLAEDVLQEALESALERWPRDGVPDSPAAWLSRTARNRAIDRFRRDARFAERVPQLVVQRLLDDGEEEADDEAIPDERLKLIFTCCHPALSPETQVALTLRVVCGLTTERIAQAFITPVPTMAQRLVRAKRKIRDAGIPYRVPPPELLAERLDAVLAVLYLVFNAGYQRPPEPDSLSAEGLRLAALLDALLPGMPEVIGLRALMTLHAARECARFDANGVLVTLESQDRTLWSRSAIEDGLAMVERALKCGRVGPYQLQAAIAALHAEATTADATDWPQIAALYALLERMQPTDVVRLNHAAAVAMVEGPQAGLSLIDALAAQGTLESYALLHAARADLLRRLGRTDAARDAYERAAELTDNDSEYGYYRARIKALRTA